MDLKKEETYPLFSGTETKVITAPACRWENALSLANKDTERKVYWGGRGCFSRR